MSDKERILIVDDDESGRRSLALVFDKQGYQVETAASGREALQKAQERPFNLALLDIRLPDMQGVELLAPLREAHPDIELIVVTGHASLETAIKAANDGAAGYITKPLRLDRVLAKVADVLERQRLVVENRRLYEVARRELAERIRAQEEKEAIQAQLFQAQKMEAIGRLTGGIAHDFNNLLTAILGYAGLLLESLGPNEPLREEIEQIEKAGRRAATLTRQLLLFSRKQAFQPRYLELDALVVDMEKMLRRLTGEDIELSIAREPRPAGVQADPGQIEQVLLNLVVNARDAMPEGGRLSIQTETVELDAAHGELAPEARPGTFVRLSVADTGVGMDGETARRIFEPFFTTKEWGTGLGMAVVHGVVKQHAGWIQISSEVGQGSTFQVYLPARAKETEGVSQELVSLQGLQGQGERILLVEDEGGIRAFASKALCQGGYLVFEAADAEAALDLFERERRDFQLVFCDIVLPGDSGLHLVDELLSRKPGLRVLLSSGYLDQRSQWPTIRERGLHFVQKPYTLTDLLQAVKGALADGGNRKIGDELTII